MNEMLQLKKFWMIDHGGHTEFCNAMGCTAALVTGQAPNLELESQSSLSLLACGTIGQHAYILQISITLSGNDGFELDQ